MLKGSLGIQKLEEEKTVGFLVYYDMRDIGPYKSKQAFTS